MKKIFAITFFTLILLCAVGGLHAVDGFYIGISPEAGAYTRFGAAIGGSLSAGVEINRQFSAGVITSIFHNLDTVLSVDPKAFFRYYIPLPAYGLFVQAETGCVVFFEFNEAFPAFSGSVSAGWRFNFAENWYAEPAARFGYPFIWGVGVSAGVRIGNK